MGKRAKNHHIVPKVLQKNFTIQGDQRRIWRTKRDTNGYFRPLERKNIANTFFIKDYYTVLENDQRSDLVEREFYGKIDDFLGKLLPEVVEILNNGNIPKFSSEDLDSIRDVVMQMTKRTPDFLGEQDDVEVGRELVEKTLQSSSSEISPAERNQLEGYSRDDIRLLDIGRDVRVKATLQNSQRVNEALSQLVPRWAVSKTKHSYILASRMVYRIGNGGPNGLINPNMEMWMPIAPKIALVLVRDPENKIPQRVVESPRQIRRVNEYAIRNSFEVASNSERLLKSLIRPK